MKINKKYVTEIKPTEKEIEALLTVDDMFKQLQEIYSTEETLHNEMTGEIVKIGELWRTRGILSFFTNDDITFATVR